MKKPFIETGKIVTTHGIKGDVKVVPWCDSPEFLLDFDTLYLSNGQQPLRVEKIRVQKNTLLIKFAGYDSIEQAVSLRGKILYLDRKDIALEDGDYLMQDLIGMEVFDADSLERYGEIYNITETGANDVYYIRFADGSEKLIPAIKEVVININLDENKMFIRPLKGLFDDAD